MSDAEPYDLSPKDVAEALGVHEDTVKRWVKDGQLAAFRTPGRWLRFRRSDIDGFLERRRSEGAPESVA